jgi:hypothetical protein
LALKTEIGCPPEAANLTLLVTHPEALDLETAKQAAELAEQQDRTVLRFSPPDGGTARDVVRQVNHRRLRFAAAVPDTASQAEDLAGTAGVLYVTRNPVEPDVYRAVRKTGFSGTFCFRIKTMGADEAGTLARAMDAMRDALRAAQ